MKQDSPLHPAVVRLVRLLARAAAREAFQCERKTDPPPAPVVEAAPTTLALDIKAAAAAVGLSRAQFYRLYINSGRVRAIKTGGRDRVIDYAELQAAYKKLRTELPRATIRARKS